MVSAAMPLSATRRAMMAVLGAFVIANAGAAEVQPARHMHGTAGAKPARPELGTSTAFAPDGALYAVTKDGQHVLLHRSADDGRNWEAPVVVNAEPEQIAADGENRPKLAFDADGAALVSWTRPLAKRFTGEIRFARADDRRHFTAPVTVHRDRQEITHRFESLAVTGAGKVVLAWIDKRDLELAQAANRDYRGAAIYAAISEDGGRSFRTEQKIADHSCECCRIGIIGDTDGLPLLMWRHVFEPNERDHAVVKLSAEGAPGQVARATFDRWRIDACPHHGPSLAVAPDGTRHAVWFNEKDGEGRVFYGRLKDGRVDGQRALGGERAAHADIATAGRHVAIVWKEFDGERTRLQAEVSADGGATFSARALAATGGASDQPRVIRRGDALFAFWRTENEGMQGYRLE
ncbi:exo-alpha-sialidase [Azoarcus sp. CIB]|uniref:exo-alpha-sialidase n=1 Tax=Aromatoleum sp. (strain CIB) TaxID=198107 RepID=UPI000A75D20D|nr:exo-alpha-sialidase [Azoarcus sp. CIB]